MNNFNGYSLEAVIGMFFIGVFCTIIGLLVSLSTLFKGEIATFAKYGENYRFKIRNIKPLKFWYFCALLETLILGPVMFLLGIVGLFISISTQILK